MNTDEQIETTTMERFVVASKRARYLSMVSHAKRRRKFLEGLYHFSDFDARFMVAIPPSEQHAEAIEAMLRGMGAGDTCYLISTDAELDGCTWELGSALEAIVGVGGGALASCIPGQLAYFEGESPGDRYILSRLP